MKKITILILLNVVTINLKAQIIPNYLLDKYFRILTAKTQKKYDVLVNDVEYTINKENFTARIVGGKQKKINQEIISVKEHDFRVTSLDVRSYFSGYFESDVYLPNFIDTVYSINEGGYFRGDKYFCKNIPEKIVFYNGRPIKTFNDTINLPSSLTFCSNLADSWYTNNVYKFNSKDSLILWSNTFIGDENSIWVLDFRDSVTPWIITSLMSKTVYYDNNDGTKYPVTYITGPTFENRPNKYQSTIYIRKGKLEEFRSHGWLEIFDEWCFVEVEQTNVTNINNIIKNNIEKQNFYDIKGNKIDVLKKGEIFIHNGRKYIK